MTHQAAVDPKQIFKKCIEQKPKTKTYAWVRNVLTILGIVVVVLISGFVIAVNLLETAQVSPGHDELSPYVGKNFNLPFNSKVIGKQIQQVISDQFVDYKTLDVSIEFVVTALVLCLMAYLIYRNTDWPFVKNKFFLVSLIIVMILFIGGLFLNVFQKDSRIPRALREQRDNIREMFSKYTGETAK